jgi:glycerol-3-phosphate dehydrogenase (NAD(P)+)
MKGEPAAERSLPVPREMPPAAPGPVAVVGDGGWGTALALVLHGRGVDVRLWSREPDYAREMARTARNPRYLPGVPLPRGLLVTGDAAEAFDGIALAVSAVPTQHLRATWGGIAGALPRGAPVCSVTKGIELKTLERPTQILAEALGRRALAVLSGPSHAEEVARGLPAAVVVASRSAALARRVQDLFSTDRFRVYRLTDVVGVEFAGAAKNVVALAAGILDGCGLGDNAKAALITRGSVEIGRLGVRLGARRATFAGLAGMGDLIVTCASRHGRNRAVGERIGRGERLEDILTGMRMVAEGVATTRSIVGLARRMKVEMPIAREVHHVLFDGKAPLEAVKDLMLREPKRE